MFNQTLAYFDTVLMPCNTSTSTAMTYLPPILGLTPNLPSSPAYLGLMGDLSHKLANGSYSTLLLWVQSNLKSFGQGFLVPTAAEDVPYMPPNPPCGETHYYVIVAYPEPEDFSIPSDYIQYFANVRADPGNVEVRLNSDIPKLLEDAGLGVDGLGGHGLIRVTGDCW
ncbi:MAG: hypothetical protein M1834_001954 [Cirrosporium novae-zelandiae]|nr:MAG: hypothetical protein M1834_001954 [Cirrosporium novae-zelandiae]